MTPAERILAAVAVTFGEGCYSVCKERLRQIEDEGWTSEHDDQHKEGQLADAASTYAMTDKSFDNLSKDMDGDLLDYLWPFDKKWLKVDENRIRSLEKAGALIAAEIDRLKRLQDGDV